MTDRTTIPDGLANERTRLVGDRTGVLADAIVGVVRFSRRIQERVGRFLSRSASVITVLGWTTIVLVPIAFLAGYGLGWRELVVVAWAGVVLLAIAAVYLVGRTSLSVDLAAVHARVVVGEQAEGQVTVVNPGRRRVLGTTIEVPIGDAVAELSMPSLRRDAESVQTFAIPTTRRGVVLIGPARSVRADPLGLVRRELVWTGQKELFVHPRTIAIPSTSTGFVRDLEGKTTKDLSNSDIAFHALREYQPGDERRYIHWKSTAKTGRYMVRQFEETRRSHLVIALSLAEGDYADEEEFELAVGATGSLGAQAIRDARTVSVVVSEKTPEFAKRKVYAVRPLSTVTRSRLLDDLAVIESARSALRIAEVARVTAEEVVGISVAFLVCGSGATTADLRAASTKFPLGVEVVAIVCDPTRIPGYRRIAGLSVMTIGYLEDLQKALARSAAA